MRDHENESLDKLPLISTSTRRQEGILSALGIQTAVGGLKDYASHISPYNLNPVVSTIAYHGGDYLNGYIDAYYPYLLLNAIFPKISPSLKLAASSGLSLAALALAEVPQ